MQDIKYKLPQDSGEETALSSKFSFWLTDFKLLTEDLNGILLHITENIRLYRSQ